MSHRRGEHLRVHPECPRERSLVQLATAALLAKAAVLKVLPTGARIGKPSGVGNSAFGWLLRLWAQLEVAQSIRLLPLHATFAVAGVCALWARQERRRPRRLLPPIHQVDGRAPL